MYVVDYLGFYKEALVFLQLMLCTTVHFTLYRIMSGGKHRLMDTLFSNHCATSWKYIMMHFDQNVSAFSKFCLIHKSGFS